MKEKQIEIGEDESQKNINILMDMRVGQQISFGEWKVIGVPGGWIFSNGPAATFVPRKIVWQK
jgi:hypothetical protein